MKITQDPLFNKEYNCKKSDLVDGFPPNDKGTEDGSKMYVWDDTTRELTSIYKRVFGVWNKI